MHILKITGVTMILAVGLATASLWAYVAFNTQHFVDTPSACDWDYALSHPGVCQWPAGGLH